MAPEFKLTASGTTSHLSYQLEILNVTASDLFSSLNMFYTGMSGKFMEPFLHPMNYSKPYTYNNLKLSIKQKQRHFPSLHLFPHLIYLLIGTW